MILGWASLPAWALDLEDKAQIEHHLSGVESSYRAYPHCAALRSLPYLERVRDARAWMERGSGPVPPSFLQTPMISWPSGQGIEALREFAYVLNFATDRVEADCQADMNEAYIEGPVSTRLDVRLRPVLARQERWDAEREKRAPRPETELPPAELVLWVHRAASFDPSLLRARLIAEGRPPLEIALVVEDPPAKVVRGTYFAKLVAPAPTDPPFEVWIEDGTLGRSERFSVRPERVSYVPAPAAAPAAAPTEPVPTGAADTR